MSAVDGPKISAGLVQRVKNILVKPDAEWAAIESEPASIQGLFTGYAAILAAIGPLCGIVGRSLLGMGLFHVSIIAAVVGAVVGWVLSLAGVFLFGLVIEALAPSFDGTKDRLSAFKVAVYSWTAAWLAGVFQIFLPLAPLGILGLYSFYLLYRGLPVLMKAPQEKALGYTAVTVIIGVVIYAVVLGVAASVMTFGLLTRFY
jgi:hypothetical protein